MKKALAVEGEAEALAPGGRSLSTQSVMALKQWGEGGSRVEAPAEWLGHNADGKASLVPGP